MDGVVTDSVVLNEENNSFVSERFILLFCLLNASDSADGREEYSF